MAVATTYDLSEITDALVAILTSAVSSGAPIWGTQPGQVPFFTINVTSSSPETMRASTAGECQLNLYLMHVGQNPFLRNTPILGNNALRNAQLPLSLDLSYLLTAYAADNAGREQQAMSIALRTFNDQPLYLADNNYLTVTLGADKLDEMSRLWQSFTVAYRFSTIFRVAVALLTPSQPPDPVTRQPTSIGLTMAPTPADTSVTPLLFGLARTVDYTLPPATDTNPDDVVFAATPLAISAGQTILVGGQGLDVISEITLATLDGTTSWSITGWQTVTPGAPSTPSASVLALKLPSQYAIGGAPTVPGSLPTPGVYLLSVGTTNPAFTTPAIPLVIAPMVTGVGTPPVLAPVGQTYTIDGAGFVPGATQIYIGNQQLTSAEITVSSDGTTISFTLPATVPAGLQTVRIRVDGIDTPPAWQLVAP